MKIIFFKNIPTGKALEKQKVYRYKMFNEERAFINFIY